MVNSPAMGGRLEMGGLMCKEGIFIMVLKYILTLEAGGLVAFGYFGDFTHVKFKTRQLIVDSLSKRELALGVLQRMWLFEVFNVEYTL
jgi:hypothetical protein